MQRIAMLITLIALAFVVAPRCALTTVPIGYVGVRSSNFSGVLEEDLAPGWHLDLPGVHRMSLLPSFYQFADYSAESSEGGGVLLIRTRDNNNVMVDVTVPYRIREGEAFEIMKAGNHLSTGEGLRFQRLAADTTVSVLREELAALTSSDFYNTEKRLAVATVALARLNEKLGTLHLEAEAVLIRAVSFRAEYEQQLQAIQLNEQNKLLDGARERVAKQQQELDNFELETNALVAARGQEWIHKRADLERAYQVGVVALDAANPSPSESRRALAALSDEEREKLRDRASEILGIDRGRVIDAYLLGIKAIEAETLEYRQRVIAEADGIAARLKAEGEASVATVRGDFESKLNVLLGSPAGRAYVAYKVAENIRFAETLTFRSSDGIPSVLRLREFTRLFMGN
jgi:regulator of protease activity HflC (stomatin/prohibitin superfamily)